TSRRTTAQAEKLREELTVAQVDRRRTRRGRHPGVCRTRPAACRRPLGAGFPRPATAVPTTVLSLRNRVRWKSVYWNRRDRTGFQLLARNQNRKCVWWTGGESDPLVEPQRDGASRRAEGRPSTEHREGDGGPDRRQLEPYTRLVELYRRVA